MALDDNTIIRRIQYHVDNGINSEDGEVTQVRQAMFARYLGELYGNERDGYSKITTRQGFEAVEWALPSLMRIFLGGVKPVSFRPTGPDDVEQAKHETDVVSYWFNDGNEDESGFLVLYTWLKDILMYPNGYVKVFVDQKQHQEKVSYTGLLTEQIDLLRVDGAEVQVTRKYTMPGSFNTLVYDVSVTNTVWKKQIVVASVAPDECIVAHNHHRLDVDTAKFVCVRTQKTRSDLIQEGYAQADLEDLSADDTDTWNTERVLRLFYTDEQPDTSGDSLDTEADETFWVHECYMALDYDEDGVNELRKIVMAGCKILENEPEDMQPVVAASAIPIPHKHVGMSYMEIVADLQELMTTLTRQLLDNIYKQNVHRKYISEQALLSDNSTMDQLLDGNSEVIIVRGSPADAIMPEINTPIVAEIAGVMEQFRDSSQMRTGVAPQISLDPSVLEKSTMGAFMGALEQASQRLELLARLFAETAFKKVFQKIHYLLRTYFEEPQDIQINGKWVQVNPTQWRRRSNMTVNVGLGFNNKEVMLGLLSQLLTVQREALGMGLADAKKIYATLETMIEQSNLGHAATYFNDPNAPDFQPPEPAKDPAMILAEAQAESLRAEIGRKDRESMAKIEHDAAKLQADIAAQKEAAEAKGVELHNALLTLEQTKKMNAAQIAEIDAKITAMNRDPKRQGDAVESTSDDEFARGRELVHGDDQPDTDDEDDEDEADEKPDGMLELAKAFTEHSKGLTDALNTSNARAAAPRTIKRDADNNIIGME